MNIKLIYSADENGKTPLHIAVIYKQINLAKILLEKGAKVNIQDVNGFAPLHYAAMGGHFAIMKLLMDYNADINLNKRGYSPLFCLSFYYAPRQNNKTVNKQIAGAVAYLLGKKANIHIRPLDKLFSHYYFALQGHDVAVRILLGAGAREIEYCPPGQEFTKAIENFEKIKQSDFSTLSIFTNPKVNAIVCDYLEKDHELKLLLRAGNACCG